MHYRTKEKERACPSKIHTQCGMSEYYAKLILSLKECIALKVYLNFLSIFIKDMQEVNQEVGKPSQRMLFLCGRELLKTIFLRKQNPFQQVQRLQLGHPINSQTTKLILKMFLNWPKQRVKTNTWKHIEYRVLHFASEIQMCGYKMIKSLFKNRT